MTFSEVKRFLYEIVKRYHPGAMVVWTNTKGVTPKPPYITLGYNNLNRHTFPWFDVNSEHKYYNYDFVFEINLYTAGKRVKVGNDNYYENTSVDDLEEFIRFLDSEEITGEFTEKNITIVTSPPIRNLSELIGDTKFSYRAMCEFSVSYVGTADGSYGIGGADIPNASGGGTDDMADNELSAIEEVEIITVYNEGGAE